MSISLLKNLVLKENGYNVFLTAFLLYMCVGIFPLYCYESDSMHTIMGMATLYNQGIVVPPTYHYEYAMQPLVYFLVVGIRHLLPILTCEQIYCGLTGITALIFVPLSVFIINKLTHLNKNIILFALFLIPETMAIGMYPNTAILALVPTMIGLLCILNYKYIFGIVALAIAPLFRVDVLMIYPVVLLFFMFRGESFASGMKKSVLLGLCVTLLMVAGFALMQANPLNSTLKSYESWNDKVAMSKILFAILSFYDLVNFILVPLGIYLLVKEKRYSLMLLAVIPMLLNHFVYRSMACATKHFLYMLPFAAILTSIAIDWIKEITISKPKMRYALICALVLFLFGSTRIHHSGKPWRNDVNTAEAQCGPVLHLFTENVTPLKISFGIGAGEVITTLDEQMLFTGNAVYPFYAHTIKENGLRRRKQATSFIGDRNCMLIVNSWENKANLALYYMDRGFALKKDGKEIALRNGSQHITLHDLDWTDLTGDLPSREKGIEESIGMAKKLGKPCFIYNTGGYQIFLCNRQVERGNLQRVPGTESLYFINPNK